MSVPLGWLTLFILVRWLLKLRQSWLMYSFITEFVKAPWFHCLCQSILCKSLCKPGMFTVSDFSVLIIEGWITGSIDWLLSPVNTDILKLLEDDLSLRLLSDTSCPLHFTGAVPMLSSLLLLTQLQKHLLFSYWISPWLYRCSLTPPTVIPKCSH